MARKEQDALPHNAVTLMCMVWRDVFVESPCEEVGFSSYLWPSRRCAWSPANNLHGLLQMGHTRPVVAGRVGSIVVLIIATNDGNLLILSW